MTDHEATDRRRDAVLALVATISLLAGTRALGVPVARLFDADALAAAVVGIAGAVALELAMAHDPETARRLWADRRVRWGGTALVAAGGPAVVVLGGPRLGLLAVATLLGGLCGYVLLLAAVVSGALPSPETWFDRA